MGSSARFGSNKFKAAEDVRFERKRNTREERDVPEGLPKILFSFRDFDINQIPPGQNFEIWQEHKLLAEMCTKLRHLSELTVIEAIKKGLINVYDTFPGNSDFKHPTKIPPTVRWAVVTNIKGQKGRVAGHMDGNIFYVVFLDMDHRFYIVSKKHT
jgi:hypothetical protein